MKDKQARSDAPGLPGPKQSRDWDHEEELVLIIQHACMGHRWSHIARLLDNGRSENDVKNRWNNVLRSKTARPTSLVWQYQQQIPALKGSQALSAALNVWKEFVPRALSNMMIQKYVDWMDGKWLASEYVSMVVARARRMTNVHEQQEGAGMTDETRPAAAQPSSSGPAAVPPPAASSEQQLPTTLMTTGGLATHLAVGEQLWLTQAHAGLPVMSVPPSHDMATGQSLQLNSNQVQTIPLKTCITPSHDNPNNNNNSNEVVAPVQWLITPHIDTMAPAPAPPGAVTCITRPAHVDEQAAAPHDNGPVYQLINLRASAGNPSMPTDGDRSDHSGTTPGLATYASATAPAMVMAAPPAHLPTSLPTTSSWQHTFTTGLPPSQLGPTQLVRFDVPHHAPKLIYAANPDALPRSESNLSQQTRQSYAGGHAVMGASGLMADLMAGNMRVTLGANPAAAPATWMAPPGTWVTAATHPAPGITVTGGSMSGGASQLTAYNAPVHMTSPMSDATQACLVLNGAQQGTGQACVILVPRTTVP